MGLHLEALVAGQIVKIPFGVFEPKRFQMLAMRWSKQAAQRQQWIGREVDAALTQENARVAIEESGLTEANLQTLLDADVVQIVIPWSGSEEVAWETRVMPWEFIIHQALRSIDQNRPTPCIVRHLQSPRWSRERAVPLLRSSDIIALISTPPRGADEKLAAFEREIQILSNAIAPTALKRYRNLTVNEFRDAAIGTLHKKEDLIFHILAAEEFRTTSDDSAGKPRPHIWLPSTDPKLKHAEWLSFEAAAKLFARSDQTPQRRPKLVSFGFNHTGPRLAALTVAHGAHAALGFQDTSDESIRVNFFHQFYRHYASSNGDLLTAFRLSQRALAPNLQGTGIVLWSRYSLLQNALNTRTNAANETKSRVPQKNRSSAPRTKQSGLSTGLAMNSFPALDTLTELATPPTTQGAPLIDAEAVSSLNYAVMHNQPTWDLAYSSADQQGPLFRRFNIPGNLPHIDPANPTAEITISLQAGDITCKWGELTPLEQTLNPLAKRIRVPLTSKMARTLGESIHTLIEAEIRVRDKLVFRRSFSTTILAIDEWRDDGVAHIWLPSFVHSRDPAIRDLIRLARHDLCTIADDFHAGFDGYQSGDPLVVDRQVQSIWSAVVQEWRLGYINPPPTFTDFSQRLRRPSRIRQERAGTCIDLSLLLAAALEYIDIHPLLILAPGHAYLAYCREAPQGLNLFSKISVARSNNETSAQTYTSADVDSISRETQVTSDERDMRSWVYGKDQHRQIVEAINDGRIAAIEATGLTRNLSFSTAKSLGAKKLRRRLEFDCLIDIRHARRLGVTPLPLDFEHDGT